MAPLFHAVCHSLLFSDLLTSLTTVAMWYPAFICLLVCRQDYTKSYKRLWLKFSAKIRHGPT